MGHRNTIPVLAIILCVAASLISFQLLAMHLGGSEPPPWFEAGCGEDSSLGSDCAAVLATPYSYWPPKLADEPKGRPHIPVAFLGLLYYSTLTIWLIGVGRVSYERRRWHLLPVALTAIGLLGSANFVAIMFAKIDKWCLWCMVTHVLNALVAACLILMWPRRATDCEEKGSTNQTTSTPHPSGRLAFVTLFAILLMAFGQVQFLGRTRRTQQAMNLEAGLNECMDTVKLLGGAGDPLLAMWLDAPEHTIAIHADDPMRWQEAEATAPLQAVVFSDFECPSCRALAVFLEEKVLPLFDGHLTLVFKHYPLNRDCNPATQTQMHRQACHGATLAEAARALGGSDAFWKAHDYIFAHQDKLKNGTLSTEAVATAAGIDAGRFAGFVGSGIALARIAKDATEGKRYGLRSTPALFISGREVRALARGDIRFWDKLADYYWRGRNEPRPASTRLNEPAKAASSGK